MAKSPKNLEIFTWRQKKQQSSGQPWIWLSLQKHLEKFPWRLKKQQNSKNKENYPSCVRKYGKVIQEKDSSNNVYYYLQGLDIYKNVGFSIDNNYFDFRSGSSGRYKCSQNDKIIWVGKTDYDINPYDDNTKLRAATNVGTITITYKNIQETKTWN